MAYQYKRCQASSHPTGSCSACGHCGPEGRIGVILSGPNTGGKTVTLKNHWALCRSAKIGAPVPAVDAQLPLYNRILTDIGDQQSIESSLSTLLLTLPD